jgi:hypothetical protein
MYTVYTVPIQQPPSLGLKTRLSIIAVKECIYYLRSTGIDFNFHLITLISVSNSPSSQFSKTRCLTLTSYICVMCIHSCQKGQVSNRSCEPRAVKICVEVKGVRHAMASLLLILTIESSVVNFSILQIQCYHLDRSGDGTTVIFLSDGTYYYTVQCHRRVRRVQNIYIILQRCVCRIYRR